MSRLMFAVVATLFTCLLVWASSFELDQVIRAEAKIVPIKDVVQVQNRFAGTLQQVQISLGDRVKQGDVLFVIDPEDSAIDLEQTRQALWAARAEYARVDALINQSELQFSPGTPRELEANQRALWAAKLNEHASKLEALEIEIRRLRLSIAESRAAARSANTQIDLIQREIDIVTPLVAANAEPEVRLIRLQREQNELRERAELSDLSAQRFESDIAATQSQIRQLQGGFKLEHQELLARAQVEITRLENEVDRTGDRAARSQVISPIDGIVTALPFAVAGQIADAGTVLAEVVPAETEYQVEARLRPMDVGNVALGQAARLSLAAYDFADYGHIDARLSEVAHNITEDPEVEPYFKAILSIQSPQFSKTGAAVNLMPGLIGQIDVLGDPVTVLSYVTKPVAKVGARALTEQ